MVSYICDSKLSWISYIQWTRTLSLDDYLPYNIYWKIQWPINFTVDDDGCLSAITVPCGSEYNQSHWANYVREYSYACVVCPDKNYKRIAWGIGW